MKQYKCKVHGILNKDNAIRRYCLVNIKHKPRKQYYLTCKICRHFAARYYNIKYKRMSAKEKKSKQRQIELKKIHDREYKALSRKELKDYYIKKLLVSKTGLKYKDIPHSLVELKRAEMLLKRVIKEKQDDSKKKG